MQDLKFIGKRRRALGLTQQKLAKEVGISQSLVTKIERGEVDPSFSIGQRLLEVLDSMEHAGERTAEDIMHRQVISVRPADSIGKVADLAKKHGISQMPVMENGRMTGAVVTENLIGVRDSERVSTHMSDTFPTVRPSTPLSGLGPLLRSSKAVVVVQEGRIVGIITAQDTL